MFSISKLSLVKLLNVLKNISKVIVYLWCIAKWQQLILSLKIQTLEMTLPPGSRERVVHTEGCSVKSGPCLGSYCSVSLTFTYLLSPDAGLPVVSILPEKEIFKNVPVGTEFCHHFSCTSFTALCLSSFIVLTRFSQVHKILPTYWDRKPPR